MLMNNYATRLLAILLHLEVAIAKIGQAFFLAFDILITLGQRSYSEATLLTLTNNPFRNPQL